MPVSRKKDSSRNADAKKSKPDAKRAVVNTLDGVADEIRRDPKAWAEFKRRMRLMTVFGASRVRNMECTDVSGRKLPPRKDFSVSITVNGWTFLEKDMVAIPQMDDSGKYDIWQMRRENIVALVEALNIHDLIFNHTSSAGADNKFFDIKDRYDAEFLSDLRALVGAYADLRDVVPNGCKYYYAYLQRELHGITEALKRRRVKYVSDGLADGSADAMLGRLPTVTLAEKDGLPKPPKKGKRGGKTARKVFDKTFKALRKGKRV